MATLVNACFTAGKCIFDANVLKSFPLTKKLVKIICGNNIDNYTNRSFTRVCRKMGFVSKGVNKIKYKTLIELNEVNKYMNKLLLKNVMTMVELIMYIKLLVIFVLLFKGRLLTKL